MCRCACLCTGMRRLQDVFDVSLYGSLQYFVDPRFSPGSQKFDNPARLTGQQGPAFSFQWSSRSSHVCTASVLSVSLLPSSAVHCRSGFTVHTVDFIFHPAALVFKAMFVLNLFPISVVNCSLKFTTSGKLEIRKTSWSMV